MWGNLISQAVLENQVKYCFRTKISTINRDNLNMEKLENHPNLLLNNSLSGGLPKIADEHGNCRTEELEQEHKSHEYHVTSWVTSYSCRFEVLLDWIVFDRFDTFSAQSNAYFDLGSE